MPDFKQFIEPFQQLVSTKGGKMLTIILFAFTAILAAIITMLWLGTLVLEGMGGTVFNIALVLFALLVALAIYLILQQSSDTKLREKVADAQPENEEERKTVETDRLRRWSRRVVLIGMLIMLVVIYIFGWMMIIKDLIIPAVQNITVELFDWTIKSLANNILMPFVLVMMWIIMPFMMYLELSGKQRRRKNTQDTQARRRHQ